MRRLTAVRVLLVPVVGFAALLVGGASCGPPCDRTLPAGANINAAISAASSGDAVCLHGGTYRQTVTVTKPVVIEAVDGETPVIDGSTLGLAPHDGLFNVNAGVSGAAVIGLTIQNSGGRGLQNDGDHGHYSRLLIRHTYNAGIMTTGYSGNASYNSYTDLEVTDAVYSNTAHNCNCWESAVNNYGGVGPVGHNAYLRMDVHDNNGEGHTYVDYDTDTDGTYVGNRGGTSQLGVYLDGVQHVVIDNATTQGLMLADEQNPARNANNTVRDSHISLGLGLRFWNAGTAGTGLKNDVFDNNTISSGVSFDGGNHSGTYFRDNDVTGPVSGLFVGGISTSGNTFH